MAFKQAVSAGVCLSIGYLAAAAWLHLWLAALAFKDSYGVPLLILSALGPITSLLTPTASDSDLQLVAGGAIAVAATAVVAAIGMAARKRPAVWLWLAIVGIVAVWSAGILIDYAMFPTNPHSPYAAGHFGPVWWPIFWPASFGIAWWIAWRGTRDEVEEEHSSLRARPLS